MRKRRARLPHAPGARRAASGGCSSKLAAEPQVAIVSHLESACVRACVRLAQLERVWLCVADGCSLGSVVRSVTVALRHFALGVDPTAAYWDFDLLDGHGGWRAEGCHITGSGGNTTTLHCTHHNNFAVLMVSSPICDALNPTLIQ